MTDLTKAGVVTLNRDEYDQLRHICNVVDAIIKHPDTRAPFLKLAKLANPHLTILGADCPDLAAQFRQDG